MAQQIEVSRRLDPARDRGHADADTKQADGPGRSSRRDPAGHCAGHATSLGAAGTRKADVDAMYASPRRAHIRRHERAKIDLRTQHPDYVVTPQRVADLPHVPSAMTTENCGRSTRPEYISR